MTQKEEQKKFIVEIMEADAINNMYENNMIKHDKQWFIDRVDKRVFRTESKCKCDTCKHVAENGLVIFDELHAQYLYDCQNEMGLYYFDKK